MRIQTPGFIQDQLLFLGTRHSCIYLLMGESYALIGGGVAWEVARLESQLDEFGIDRSRIKYLVISHAHHDHCGAVPYLIQMYPHIRTISSDYCAKILMKENAVRLMKDVNRGTLKTLKRPQEHQGISLDFLPIQVDRRVGDDDRLDLGEGLSMRFFTTPGHSRCSLTVYVPEMRALFPGDAIPVPETGKRELTVTANHDYDHYLESLGKLEELSVALVGYEHGGVIIEEDVQDIISRGIEATRSQRERIQTRYKELGDINLLIDETAQKFHELELFKLVPWDIMKAIIDRMVRSALGLV